MGWMIGGPFAGILGFAIGSFFDTDFFEEARHELRESFTRTPESEFRLSLLILSAVVIKSDGASSQADLNFVRNFFQKKFGLRKANESMSHFNRINRNVVYVEDVCMRLRGLIDYSSRLHLIEYLFHVAQADGYVNENEIQTIKKISNLFGLHYTEFNSIYGRFFKPRPVITPYQVLGVLRTDSVTVIKKAYRRLTLKYHPDKVAHQSAGMQKESREKYQRIVEAYEMILSERGLT